VFYNLLTARSEARTFTARLGVLSTNGEKRNVYRLLVGKPEGKKPLGRPRHRWIDKIKMDLLEIGLSAVDWIGLVWLRIGTGGELL
jgi:hypothetical protein